MKKLTESQRKLVEDYHYVIYCALKKLQKPACEYYDIAALRLCEAALSFTGEYENFFSYAFKSIQNAFYRTKKHSREISVHDIEIPDNRQIEAVEDKQYYYDILNECSKIMSRKEMEAIKRVIQGIKSKTPSQASARDRALKKLKRYIGGEEIKPANHNWELTKEQRQERNDKIIEMANNGHTNKLIAQLLKVSERTVRQIIFERKTTTLPVGKECEDDSKRIPTAVPTSRA